MWLVEGGLTTSLIPAHLHLATLESFARACILRLLHDPCSHLLEQDPTNTYPLFSRLPSYPPHRATQTPEDHDHNRTIPLPLPKPSLIQACSAWLSLDHNRMMTMTISSSSIYFRLKVLLLKPHIIIHLKAIIPHSLHNNRQYFQPKMEARAYPMRWERAQRNDITFRVLFELIVQQQTLQYQEQGMEQVWTVSWKCL